MLNGCVVRCVFVISPKISSVCVDKFIEMLYSGIWGSNGVLPGRLEAKLVNIKKTTIMYPCFTLNTPFNAILPPWTFLALPTHQPKIFYLILGAFTIPEMACFIWLRVNFNP